MLHALEREELAGAVECRVGECGECRQSVTQGRTQNLLTGVEDSQSHLACCSVPVGDGITDHGKQGADLLGRFAQHDQQKAETLRTMVSRQAGRDVPFRIPPLGDGFREPSLEETLAQASKSPFGTLDGADMEAAGTMAKALLKKGDYLDAYAYLKSAPRGHAALHGRRA